MEDVEKPDVDVVAEEAELAQKEFAEDESQHEDEVTEAEEAKLAEEESADEEEESQMSNDVVVVGALVNELSEERIAESEIKEFDGQENGEPENKEAEEHILIREIDQADDSKAFLRTDKKSSWYFGLNRSSEALSKRYIILK
nr:unnamed protein product [Haemonchus contortus]